MANFKVFLNPKSSPPVRVTPAFVDIPRGDHTINWTRGRSQSFDFVGLSIAGKASCFGTLTVNPDQVSVLDRHRGTRETTGKFPFDVTVSSGGKLYSSNPSPTQDRVGGDPTIRNT